MVERETVRTSYDELAGAYAQQRSEDGLGMEILETVLEPLDDPERVLDAGCGNGEPVLSRIDRTASAVGVDFSREQLRRAADAVPDAHLGQADMTALPFEDGAFDAAVAYWSLIHVPLDEHGTVLEEFSRVLRPGGHVLVCEGSGGEWVGENPDWLDTGVEMEWEIAGAEATVRQLHEAGFEVVDRWGVPETLADEEEETADDSDDDPPWAFFVGRLDD